jgi:hypothetical protein
MSHHLIAGILADFDHENLDDLAHTYDAIIAYIKRHLPSLRAAADMASSVGRAFSATVSNPAASLAPNPAPSTKAAKDIGHAELFCAFSVLEHKHRNLQQQQKRSGKRGKNPGEGNSNKKARDTQSIAPLRAEDCTSYCHAHGYQSSHTSAQCKEMTNQTFTAEMRKATGPNSPPGGSKLVRGRAPTIVGQANMMSSFVEDESKASADPPSQASITSPASPPTTGFFDEEYVQGKRVSSPPENLEGTGLPNPEKRTNQDAVLAPSHETPLKRANQTEAMAPLGESYPYPDPNPNPP